MKKKATVTREPQPIELDLRAPGGRTHRSFAFYGRSGTGKTTLASSFPGPALLLDCKDVGDDSVSDVEGLRVMDVGEWSDFEMAYWYLKQNPEIFKTAIVDTVSQLQHLAIAKVLRDKNKDEDRAGDWGVMTRREWGDVAAMMKTWIINFRDLPMEVVFIAQDRTFNVGEEDEAEGLEPEVGPALSPSVAKHLNAAVHVLGNTFIRRRTIVKKIKKGAQTFDRKESKIEYCLRLGPNPVYVTKIRKPKPIMLPDVVVDPTYEAIIKLIRGES